jgi:hypothetical protein
MTLYKAKKIINTHIKEGLAIKISQHKNPVPLIIVCMGYKNKMIKRPWHKSRFLEIPEVFFIDELEKDIDELTITPEEEKKREFVILHYAELQYKFNTLLINSNIGHIEFKDWLKDASLHRIKTLLSKKDKLIITDWMEMMNGK